MRLSMDREPRCWNCDQVTYTRVPVTLHLESGRTTCLLLCQVCYTEVYLPLVGTVEVGRLTAEMNNGEATAPSYWSGRS